MDIKTYTNIWNVEKKLYSIYDLKLPVAIGFRQVGIFFASAIVWGPLMYFLNVPFSPPIGYLVWLAPPVGITILGNKPVFEGKSIAQYIRSQVSYYSRSHVYTNIISRKQFTGFGRAIEARVWSLKKEQKNNEE